MNQLKDTTQPLKIGPYKAYPLPTGVFGLDGGAMFGTVPKVLWERSNPADSHNRIEMEARALLLVSDHKKILVDTGNGADFVEKYGPKLGPKFADMYGIQSGQEMGLLRALKNHKIKPEEISDVILTHLHFDHAGGATTTKNGKLVPTFPNATYYVQSENLKTAQTPNIRERASYYAANFEPLMQTNCLKILSGSQENLLPGISTLVMNGHTQGMQVVKISDGSTTLLYCADLIATSSHVRSAWVMGYDLNPLQVIQEKQTLLTQAAKENWILFFEHDPFHAGARVEEDKGDFKVKELIW